MNGFKSLIKPNADKPFSVTTKNYEMRIEIKIGSEIF
jgi:hypothetical protein